MTDHSTPDPQIVAWMRLADVNGHGPLLTPESAANLTRAEMLASVETCDHCAVHALTIPVACQRWAVELLHEHHCPLHDDNTDAVVRTATWE